MATTYQSFYQNEERALQLEIDDNAGTDFVPSAANYQIEDKTGTVIIPWEPAMVVGNTVSINITNVITATPAVYKVIWEIISWQAPAPPWPGKPLSYFHVTELTIQQL